MLATCWPNYVGPMLAHLGAYIEAMLVICETISVERPPRCQFFLPDPSADPNSRLATAKQHEAGIGPAECQCRASLSEACGKQALEPRRQRPNSWPVTAKQHEAASFKRCRPAGCQCRTSLSEASRKEALEPRRRHPNSRLATATQHGAASFKKGVGLQDANAGRHFLKPVENKLWSHAASVQTFGSPQQNSMELPVSKGRPGCRMPRRHFLKPLKKKLWPPASKQLARHSNTAWSCQFQRSRAAECRCRMSLSEACGKQAREPRRQRPNNRPATAKQHGAASFEGSRAAECQANARRHFLKPVGSKQEARHSKTAWSCQFQRGSACRMPMPDVTFWSLWKRSWSQRPNSRPRHSTRAAFHIALPRPGLSCWGRFLKPFDPFGCRPKPGTTLFLWRAPLLIAGVGGYDIITMRKSPSIEYRKFRVLLPPTFSIRLISYDIKRLMISLYQTVLSHCNQRTIRTIQSHAILYLSFCVSKVIDSWQWGSNASAEKGMPSGNPWCVWIND